jgi:hypothetical protein
MLLLSKGSDLARSQSSGINPEVIHEPIEIRIGGELGAADPILRREPHIGWFQGHGGVLPYLSTVNVESACRGV